MFDGLEKGPDNFSLEEVKGNVPNTYRDSIDSNVDRKWGMDNGEAGFRGIAPTKNQFYFQQFWEYRR